MAKTARIAKTALETLDNVQGPRITATSQANVIELAPRRRVRAMPVAERLPQSAPVARVRSLEPLPERPQPFLKWVGGKTRILSQIVPHFPKGQLRYGEPVVGGGAVFFALQGDGRLEHAVLGDTSADLVAGYTAIRDTPHDLVAQLQQHERDYLSADADGRAALFYGVRSRHPADFGLTQTERAARLLFLNRTCFNGLWRENSRGHFNAPHGRYEQPNIVQHGKMWKAHEALQQAAVVRADFRDWPRIAKEQQLDFVYLDPPYHPLSATSSFNAYAGGGFSSQAQKELADVCGELDAMGVRWVLSNSDCAVIRDLYKRWNIQTIRAPRAVNCKGDARGDVNEVLVSNRRSGLCW
jgi:DNA adenine methylase